MAGERARRSSELGCRATNLWTSWRALLAPAARPCENPAPRPPNLPPLKCVRPSAAPSALREVRAASRVRTSVWGPRQWGASLFLFPCRKFRSFVFHGAHARFDHSPRKRAVTCADGPAPSVEGRRRATVPPDRHRRAERRRVVPSRPPGFLSTVAEGLPGERPPLRVHSSGWRHVCVRPLHQRHLPQREAPRKGRAARARRRRRGGAARPGPHAAHRGQRATGRPGRRAGVSGSSGRPTLRAPASGRGLSSRQRRPSRPTAGPRFLA